MDRRTSLPPGTVVIYRNYRHVVCTNSVDLLSFKCNDSAWRKDLSSVDNEAELCPGCYATDEED